MPTDLTPVLAALFEGPGQPPVAQRNLFDALWMRGDVPIPVLIKAVDRMTDNDLRHQQQVLGPYVTRLNRRLKKVKLAVRPGRMKGTYCVTPL